jgi:hypothetical protein
MLVADDAPDLDRPMAFDPADAPLAISALQSATIEISTLAAVGRAAAVPPEAHERLAAGQAVWLPTGGRAGRHPATVTRPNRERPARGRDRRSGRRRGRGQPSGWAAGRVRQSPAVYRRRRVLASLLVFNAVELVGVFTVGPGFWTGFAVTSLMLIGYVVHLRNESIATARRRQVAARRAAVVAAVQAEIRAEQARRAAARRDALRRAAAARAAAQREAVRLTQRYVDVDPARGARLRGRSYETGGWDVRAAGQ